jgi:hypothetical protein
VLPYRLSGGAALDLAASIAGADVTPAVAGLVVRRMPGTGRRDGRRAHRPRARSGHAEP